MGKRLYSEKRQAFRSLLKEIRLEAGLTQIALSKKLDRPQSYISDCENGHRRLDFVAVEELAQACGVDMVTFSRRYLRISR